VARAPQRTYIALVGNLSRSSIEVVSIEGSALLESIEPRAAITHWRLEVPMVRPYRIAIPPSWIEAEAQPLDGYAVFARDFHSAEHPLTTLHVEWIDSLPERRDDDFERALSDASRSLVDDWQPTTATSPADINEHFDRAPHAYGLHMVGELDDDTQHSRIVAAACAGPRDELAECERILATLQPFPPHSKRSLAWIFALAAVIAAGLVASWRIVHVRQSV
jgi:hypothetical protein